MSDGHEREVYESKLSALRLWLLALVNSVSSDSTKESWGDGDSSAAFGMTKVLITGQELAEESYFAELDAILRTMASTSLRSLSLRLVA